ncbi:MAG TPA: hypothetical protein VHD56_02755 [Tepidisphaeraceae bacterium]|nr:hypothetical protein [Tepidisphaeraceae bacterium]
MSSDEPPKPDYVDAECLRGADLVNAGKLPEAAEVFRALSSHPRDFRDCALPHAQGRSARSGHHVFLSHADFRRPLRLLPGC